MFHSLRLLLRQTVQRAQSPHQIGRVDADHQAQDWRDANTLFDLLERQVVPMFHERDADGIPQRWVAMMRRSLVTHGPRFSAARMLREYADRIYEDG